MTNLIPSLYQTIIEKASYSIVSKIHFELQQIESKKHKGFISNSTVKSGMERICSLMNEAFRSVESSIFLRDTSIDGSKYRLFATSSPPGLIRKKTYTKGANDAA